MPRMMMSAILAVALAALAGCEAPKAPDQWSPISVTATAVPLNAEQPSQTEAGELRYRGGLVLKSPSALFGGFSGISVAADGRRFVAQSDTGVWLTGDLQLDAGGALVGVRNTRIAQMRDEAGEPLQGKVASDAEDLARLPDGRYAVSFEQNHRILIYDLDGKGPFAPAEKGPGVGGTSGMHPNEGLEALAALPDGTLVGIAEHAPRGAGSPFWIWPPGAAVASPVGRANRPQGYGVSGLATMPNGDLVSVERLYLPFIGVRVNVRHIPAANLQKSPPVADGPVIGVLEPPMNLDNFESVAVAPGTDGNIRIYLIADDNFSANQRTLLFAFDWTPPATPAAATAAAASAPEAAPATSPAELTPGAAPGAAAVPTPGPPPVLAATPPPAAPAPVKTVAPAAPPSKGAEATRIEQAAAAPPPKPKPRPKPKPEPEPPPAAPSPPPPPRPSAGPPA